MNDIGVSCTKPTKVAKCPAGKSKDAGLCYGSCPADSKAIGPVCWGQCPSGMTDCGAMCGGSTSECLKAVWDSALAAGKAVYNIVKLVTGDGKVEEGKADPKKMKDAIASTPGKAKEIATTISQAFKEKKISFADLGDKAKAVAQLGKDQYDKLIAGIGGQENLKKLIEAGKNPSDIDGLIEVVKGLDPIGLADFAGTLKKPICGR